jgi:hypothetical protein
MTPLFLFPESWVCCELSSWIPATWPPWIPVTDNAGDGGFVGSDDQDGPELGVAALVKDGL